MKSKIYIFIAAIIFLMALITTSCKKFVEVAPPETQAELSKIFSDDQTATSAVVGLYYQMVAGNLIFCNGGITIYSGLCADEFANVNSNSTYDPFKTNSILSNNGTINSTFWSGPYKNIYQANAVLEGLQASTKISAPVKKQLQGEMLYIRALHYFYMVNLFGDVPLETVTNYQVNQSMPRTALDKIYDQIIADLLQAHQLLSDSYSASDNLRPNQGAVAALLARVYLFKSDWVNAEAMATEVIGSGRYSLDKLSNVFIPSSTETIFQISKQNGNVSEAIAFIPSSATVKPTFAITNNLLTAFESGDNRKPAWLKSNTVSGSTYYYPYKYKVRTSTPVSEYYVVQRLAELYLIRAEARANQNNFGSAVNDLDAIRSRAGLPSILTIYPSISKQNLLSAILKENQVELFAEWGHRWFDLKRTGNADAILGSFKGTNWQTTDQLFPIPYAQIQLNSFLSQNTGYNN